MFIFQSFMMKTVCPKFFKTFLKITASYCEWNVLSPSHILKDQVMACQQEILETQFYTLKEKCKVETKQGLIFFFHVHCFTQSQYLSALDHKCYIFLGTYNVQSNYSQSRKKSPSNTPQTKIEETRVLVKVLEKINLIVIFGYQKGSKVLAL